MVKKTARSVAIAWNKRELELERRLNIILTMYPALEEVLGDLLG